MEIDLATQFSALAHPARLDVLRLLLRRHPEAVPAGEIAAALYLKPNTLSAYLGHLHRAGLVTQTRSGTFLRYGPDIDGVRRMNAALFLECCRGRPDLCPPDTALAPPAPNRPVSSHPYRVLFMCTGNSARSIFAESILRHETVGRFEAYSAGTKPSSEPNPRAIEILASKGHDTSGLRSKNVSEYQAADAPAFDFVFTVCDQAANADCPAWPGQPLTAHWSTPDPVASDGATEAERMPAYQQAFAILRHRIRAFTALPIETLDALSLQAALDDIARQETFV